MDEQLLSDFPQKYISFESYYLVSINNMYQQYHMFIHFHQFTRWIFLYRSFEGSAIQNGSICALGRRTGRTQLRAVQKLSEGPYVETETYPKAWHAGYWWVGTLWQPTDHHRSFLQKPSKTIWSHRRWRCRLLCPSFGIRRWGPRGESPAGTGVQLKCITTQRSFWFRYVQSHPKQLAVLFTKPSHLLSHRSYILVSPVWDDIVTKYTQNTIFIYGIYVVLFNRVAAIYSICCCRTSHVKWTWRWTPHFSLSGAEGLGWWREGLRPTGRHGCLACLLGAWSRAQAWPNLHVGHCRRGPWTRTSLQPQHTPSSYAFHYAIANWCELYLYNYFISLHNILSSSSYW